MADVNVFATLWTMNAANATPAGVSIVDASDNVWVVQPRVSGGSTTFLEEQNRGPHNGDRAWLRVTPSTTATITVHAPDPPAPQGPAFQSQRATLGNLVVTGVTTAGTNIPIEIGRFAQANGTIRVSASAGNTSTLALIVMPFRGLDGQST